MPASRKSAKPAKPTRTKKVVVKKARLERTPQAKPIASYDHKLAERVNNPPVGLVHADNDPDLAVGRKTYAYEPHLDPQLVWAGKAEHTSFTVPTVSLHVHERIDPRTIVEAVPFALGANKRVAVKIIVDRGIESLRLMEAR